MTTAAQDEFNALVAASSRTPLTSHPEDAHDHESRHSEDEDEDTRHNNARIDRILAQEADRSIPTGRGLHLPPSSFDAGAATGVKGVIADARSFQAARQQSSRSNGNTITSKSTKYDGSEDVEAELESDEDDEFISQWRAQRLQELEGRSGSDIRNKRTSPSVRRYGRFDQVDALGYLDAVEKVSPNTTVVVFVFDPDCPVNNVIHEALAPLVPLYPDIHFVKVCYEDIEFDVAGTPAVLAYRDQGTLFANLTYIVDEIESGVEFDSKAVAEVLRKHGVL
jgi:hypothetical protein